MFQASLFEFNLYYSKSFKLETFPVPTSSVLIFVMNGRRQRALDRSVSLILLQRLANPVTVCYQEI